MRQIKDIIRLVFRIPYLFIAALLCIGIVLIGMGIFRGGTALNKLLTENKQLKKAISHLTDEGKIGYAKVLSQQTDAEGKVLITKLKFVETSRDNELETVLERVYEIEGDVIHFDALIVKFGNKLVMDGKKKSLYLWRRVYGEKQAPEDGFLIESPGKEPERYADLLEELPTKKRKLFWTSIWDLANDPQRLKEYGIQAIYGNVTYAKVKTGLLYIFRITPTGHVYPEVVPDL